jgi:hypothetical protein
MKYPIAPEDFQGEICEFPHLAKTEPDMGHPRWWYRNSPAGSRATPTGRSESLVSHLHAKTVAFFCF